MKKNSKHDASLPCAHERKSQRGNMTTEHYSEATCVKNDEENYRKCFMNIIKILKEYREAFDGF